MPTVYATSDYVSAMTGLDLAEISITSTATLTEGAAPNGSFAIDDVDGIGIVAGLADGDKCGRCWRVLPEVDDDGGLCGRCADAVAASDAEPVVSVDA